MQKILLFLLMWMGSSYLRGQSKLPSIEIWDRYEVTLDGPSSGNPFVDVQLSATFTNGEKTISANGFYDGEGKYKLRFMPVATGVWQFSTSSNSSKLNKKKGSFKCVAAAAANHGPVKVANTYDFQYADGKVYYPFGTTIYAWIHQGQALQEQTLNTLKAAPFNKLRFCVFPKTYTYVDEEPELYAYESTGTEKNADGSVKHQWDFKKFNPAFFAHLEKRVDDLKALGIEADLIIFHPYDKGRWGFDSMGKQNDILYLKYLTARLSSFRNIWWSMANEFDFIKSKPREDWDDYARTVVENDPYRHLCSIHNGSVYYDNWKSYFTHVSIQNGAAVEDFGRANLLRDVYFKPVIYDEVCYEGDLSMRWGRLSGEEMSDAFWQAVIAGTYATHGETYRSPGDTIFWAEGGKLIGSSPARIGFLKKLLEDGPGPLSLADEWKDVHTAQHGSDYYIIYFGKQMQSEWLFSLPKKNAPAAGTKFKAEIIDTWEMTIKPVNEIFELAEPNDYRMLDKELKKIRLPLKPYMAIRLIKVE
ncbi:MAG: DUF5060 domain-containing protein [Ferruginibacter sp.]